VATLGVIAWRLVNFWLPIPTGAFAYVSLKVKPRAGLRAMRSAIASLPKTGGPRGDSPAEADDRDRVEVRPSQPDRPDTEADR
jgi:hypothetical protein